MNAPIQLWYWPTPNGWKVSIALEELGLDGEAAPDAASSEATDPNTVVVPRKKTKEIGAIRFGMSAVRNASWSSLVCVVCGCACAAGAMTASGRASRRTARQIAWVMCGLWTMMVAWGSRLRVLARR